jgi:glycosyltransferase involved in cell wall biosynthesis
MPKASDWPARVSISRTNPLTRINPTKASVAAPTRSTPAGRRAIIDPTTGRLASFCGASRTPRNGRIDPIDSTSAIAPISIRPTVHRVWRRRRAGSTANRVRSVSPAPIACFAPIACAKPRSAKARLSAGHGPLPSLSPRLRFADAMTRGKGVALRILLVTEALVVGGAETFVLRLARKLRAIGHDAEVLCLNRDLVHPALVARFPDVPITCVPLPAIRWIKRLDRHLGLDQKIARWLTRRWFRRSFADRFDVCHSHLFGADRLLAELKQTDPAMRIVSTMHGDYNMYDAVHSGAVRIDSEPVRIVGWPAKFRAVIAAVDRWVVISHDQQRLLADRGVPPERVTRIANGFDPPARPSSSVTASAEGPITIAMVARGLPEKGWRFLLEAFARLSGECRLLLVGDSDYLSGLAAANRDPRITFTGFHPDPTGLLAAADVFAFPSVYPAESLPTVIVEALSLGLPVVATDIGEVRWMLTLPDERTAGVLLDPDPASLAQGLRAALQRYLDDRLAIRRDGAIAQQAFAKFDMARCADAYVEVYRQAAASPQLSLSYTPASS